MDWRSGFSRLAGPRGVRAAALLALVGALAMLADPPTQRWLRAQVFDTYQKILPRHRASQPAVVVAIDEASLERYGQWPWPRDRLAELIDRIAAARPAAIGVDILMPEPDRLSPRRIAETARSLDAALAARLGALPDHDATLAEALRGRPVVLGMAGEAGAAPGADERPLRSAPFMARGDPAGQAHLPYFPDMVRSRPELEAAASGWGLINAPTEGVVRHIGLLARVGERLVPNLEVEMLRVAAGLPAVQADFDARGMRTLSVGDLTVPTDPQGNLWLRFRRHEPGLQVSAAAVLAGTAPADALAQKYVLVGLTGLGLIDQPHTPLGERMPGVEIRAQLLENIFERAWLTRPRWGGPAEATLFLALALVFMRLVPRLAPVEGFALLGAAFAVLAIGGLVAFNAGGLVDVATPAAGSALVFTVVLGATLTETQRQRRELAERLAAEREAAARLAGELESARRVQMGMLPEAPGVLAADPRIDLRAFMEPARSVGGDLYDFFLLDQRTLCVMIGDVSGKGLGAAMFMALIKSLCKSAVLRQPGSLERALAQAEAEIKRENPESLFVTLLVLTLDLDTGEFRYCNAGHDPLYGLLPDQPEPRKLDHGGRPPLCVLDGYPYPVGHDRLVPGEALCLITDGITEAADRSGHLYGHKRLESVLTRRHGASPAELIEAVRQDVLAFVGEAEQADDMSVVALRWHGPAK